jgi:hypothetical protein
MVAIPTLIQDATMDKEKWVGDREEEKSRYFESFLAFGLSLLSGEINSLAGMLGGENKPNLYG